MKKEDRITKIFDDLKQGNTLQKLLVWPARYTLLFIPTMFPLSLLNVEYMMHHLILQNVRWSLGHSATEIRLVQAKTEVCLQKC